MRVFFGDYPNGLSHSDFGNSDSEISYSQFKNDVQSALTSRFGSSVARRNKCFEIHSNGYRVDADVTASFEHRRYENANSRVYLSGCEFLTDTGDRVINWPQQHLDNGIVKNDSVRRRFKRLVRILKRLQFDLIDQGKLPEKLVPSYAVECAVYNVPNDRFLDEDYYDSVPRVLAYIFNETRDIGNWNDWAEVNELKWFFRGNQAWTRSQVHGLAALMWDHIGYE
jgi:hypothetical protein